MYICARDGRAAMLHGAAIALWGKRSNAKTLRAVLLHANAPELTINKINKKMGTPLGAPNNG